MKTKLENLDLKNLKAVGGDMDIEIMKWRYQIKGAHVHVDVFVNGANAGRLIFRIEEFEEIRRESNKIRLIQFEQSE